MLPFGEESGMSISIYSPSSSLRERGLRANVERQGLALGAARERTRRAASLSRERERRLEAAIDDWENEGGAVAGVHPASRPNLLRKLSIPVLTPDSGAEWISHGISPAHR